MSKKEIGCIRAGNFGPLHGLDLCLRKTRAENHMAIMTSSFSISSVFKTSVHVKTQIRKLAVFKFLRFEERFRKFSDEVWTCLSLAALISVRENSRPPSPPKALARGIPPATSCIVFGIQRRT